MMPRRQRVAALRPTRGALSLSEVAGKMTEARLDEFRRNRLVSLPSSSLVTPVGEALLHNRDTAQNTRSWSFVTRTETHRH